MVDDHTIQRFFTLHAVLLPMLFVPVLTLHLYLVQRHGNAVPPSEESKPLAKRRSMPFFPDFMLKDLAMWLIMLNLLGFLVCIYPWDLGPQANPVAAAPEGIHPEWYFMSQFQLLKVLGNWFPGITGEIAGILLFTLGGIVWALVPLLDRSEQNVAAARAGTWIGIVALAGLVVLTLWGYQAL